MGNSKLKSNKVSEFVFLKYFSFCIRKIMRILYQVLKILELWIEVAKFLSICFSKAGCFLWLFHRVAVQESHSAVRKSDLSFVLQG